VVLAAKGTGARQWHPAATATFTRHAGRYGPRRFSEHSVPARSVRAPRSLTQRRSWPKTGWQSPTTPIPILTSTVGNLLSAAAPHQFETDFLNHLPELTVRFDWTTLLPKILREIARLYKNSTKW